MRVNLQYMLCVLLFLLAGPLCRAQAERAVCDEDLRAGYFTFQQPVGPGVEGAGYILAQPAAAEAANAGRYLAHAFFVSEITGGICAQNTDHKAFSRSLPAAGHGAGVYPAATACGLTRIAGLHPLGVDYYIYTLGKIRI